MAVPGQPFARCGAPPAPAAPAAAPGSAAVPRSGSGESPCILFYFGLGCCPVCLFLGGWFTFGVSVFFCHRRLQPKATRAARPGEAERGQMKAEA